MAKVFPSSSFHSKFCQSKKVCINASKQELQARRWNLCTWRKEEPPTWEDLRHQVQFTIQGALGDITDLPSQSHFTCVQELHNEGRRQKIFKRNGNWTNLALKKAMKAIEDGGCIIRATSRLHNILESSLKGHLTRKSSGRQSGRVGIMIAFEEKYLVNWVFKCKIQGIAFHSNNFISKWLKSLKIR